jgi:lipopolysaccharide export system permease protein
MRTLDRYFAGIFIRNFFLSLLSITALYFFQGLIGELVDHAYPPQQILFDHLLSLPDVLVMMVPPSTILATVLTLSGLTRTNELVAAFSIGIGLRRIVYLILSLVFVICCIVLVMQDRILPPTFRARMTYEMRQMKHRQDFYLDIKEDKIWYRSKNLIYNLQRFDPKNRIIHGMAVYTFDDNFNLVQVLDAKQAEFGEHGWKLLDGTVTVFSAQDQFPLSQRFKDKEIQIPETPADFQEIDKEVDGLRLKELWQYIKRIKAAGADTKGYEVKFHSRISLSFIPLVMCILGVPFSLRGRRDEGAAKDLSMCLGVTFFYWLFYSIGLSLGTNGALPPWLAAWLPSLVFASFAGVLLIRPKA